MLYKVASVCKFVRVYAVVSAWSSSLACPVLILISQNAHRTHVTRDGRKPLWDTAVF